MRSSGRSLSVSVCAPVTRLCGGWISHCGVAAEMQRVVLAADDLAGDAGDGADIARWCRCGLTLEAEWIAPVVGPVDIGAGPEHVVVPARADGRAEVAGGDIGRDDAGRGALHEQDVVGARGFVQRVGQVHDAAFDRHLAAERLEAGVAEIGVLDARERRRPAGSRRVPPTLPCRQIRPTSRRSRRSGRNSSRRGICRRRRCARGGRCRRCRAAAARSPPCWDDSRSRRRPSACGW